MARANNPARQRIVEEDVMDLREIVKKLRKLIN